MTQDCVCISVGINKYAHSIWPGDLAFAAQDATWFAHVAKRFGVRQEHIRLLLDEDATRQSILWSIRTWPRSIGSRAETVILYFAGHGHVAKEGSDAERSYLLAHDVSIEDPISNGVRLHELVIALRSLAPRSVFLFLDACHQDIGALFDVEDFRMLLRDITDNDGGCLFAMVGGHLTPTYEGGDQHGGRFTSLLLDALDRLDEMGNRSVDELARLIRQNADSGIRVVQIGSSSAWPFPETRNSCLPNRTDSKGSALVPRNQVRRVARQLRTKHGITRVIWAPALSGKSVFLQQLRAELPFAIYQSCNSDEINENVVIERVVAEFIAQFPGIFSSVDTPALGLHALSSLSKHGRAWLMLDHVERIGIGRLRTITARLSQVGIDVVAATRTRARAAPREEWIRLEPFSESEIQEWFLVSGASKKEASQAGLQLAGKSPESILQALAARTGEPSEVGDLRPAVVCRRWLAITSGFGNLDLFQHHFDIDPTIGRHLRESPLIIKRDYWHHPHDRLVEDIDEEFTEHEVGLAIRYLHREINDNPSNSFAADRLCRLVELRSQIDPLWDHSISCAIDVLISLQHHERIGTLAKRLASSAAELGTVSLSILSWASDRGIRKQFSDWLASRSDMNESADQLVMMARLSWWEGNYRDCISFASKAVDIESSPKPGLAGSARLEAGIGYFFLGDWKMATDIFSSLENSESNSARTRHWARAMKGTALGIRGIALSESLEAISRAAESLACLGDLVGAGVAYGNAGEIACKAGQLEQAQTLLDLGLRIASAQQAQINVLENNRVRAHLAMRFFGPGSTQLREIRDSLYEGLRDLHSDMELMQVQNSLATIALIEDEDDEASRLIEINERLVKGNPEYEIYWRWNRSILFGKRGAEAAAELELAQGVRLAREGNNQLAVRQYVDETRLLAEGSRSKIDKFIDRHISRIFLDGDQLQ